MDDYTTITELPASGLSQEQLQRLCQRYAIGADHAQGARTLEIACGAGLGLAHLATVSSTLVAFDYTQNVLQIAQQHNPDIPLLCADGHELPFAAGSFDRILHFEAIYYLREPKQLLAECHRVLGPAGALLICTSNPHWPHFTPGRMSIHYPTVPQLHSWLRASGFRSVELFGAFATEGKSQASKLASKLVGQLRKRILDHKLLAPQGRVAKICQRLVHGPPITLPPVLPPPLIAEQGAGVPLRVIPPAVPDTTHRVIYAAARK